MTAEAYWLGVVCGGGLVALVLEMVRRRYLRGRFAVVWLFLGVAAVVIALFPRVLEAAATAVGVTIPLNLLLVVGSLAILVLVMQLSAEVGRLHEKVRSLAEEVALLRVGERPMPGGSSIQETRASGGSAT